MANSFRFKHFEVRNESSALKLGTDAVLLGASMSLKEGATRMLDIGTGTGVIALMAAQRQSCAVIEAIDIDGPSCEEAAFNFAASPWKERLCVTHAALENFSPSHRYSHIFSNPPFYDNSLTNPDAREARARHTESLSYRSICAFASEWLEPDGRLSLILPSDRERELVRTAASFGLHPFRIVEIHTTARKPSRRIIAEFAHERQVCAREILTLQEGNTRTEEYSRLTREFYL